MAITSYSQVRQVNVTTVTVVSDLSGTIYYHWYVDGAYVATTMTPVRSFFLETGERVRIEVLDTNNADYDPIANAPDGYPARRSIWWVRSTDSDVDHYRIEQTKSGESAAVIGKVAHQAKPWSYSLLSPLLDDLATYTWSVRPVDVAGNDGSVSSEHFPPQKIVRTPDAPAFTVSFDEGTTKVTFAAA